MVDTRDERTGTTDRTRRAVPEHVLGDGPGERWTVGLIGTLVLALAVAGMTVSFSTVNTDLHPWFGRISPVVPIGVDVGILVFGLVDVLLTYWGVPFALPRLLEWTLVGATAWLNVEAGGPVWVRVAHIAMPALWVAATETIRHVIRARLRLLDATRMERIRRSRWLLAPVSTARLWRRMVLWEVTDYREALRMEAERLARIAVLEARHGKKWHRTAPLSDRLALRLSTLAPANLLAELTIHLDHPTEAPQTQSAEAQARSSQARSAAAQGSPAQTRSAATQVQSSAAAAQAGPVAAHPPQAQSPQVRPAAGPAQTRQGEPDPAQARSAHAGSAEATLAQAGPSEARPVHAWSAADLAVGPSEATPAQANPAEARPAAPTLPVAPRGAKPAAPATNAVPMTDARQGAPRGIEEHPAPLNGTVHAVATVAQSTPTAAPAHVQSLQEQQFEARPAPAHPVDSQPVQAQPAWAHPAEEHTAPAYPAPAQPSLAHPAPAYLAEEHLTPAQPMPAHAEEHPASAHPAPTQSVPVHPAEEHSTPARPAPARPPSPRPVREQPVEERPARRQSRNTRDDDGDARHAWLPRQTASLDTDEPMDIDIEAADNLLVTSAPTAMDALWHALDQLADAGAENLFDDDGRARNAAGYAARDRLRLGITDGTVRKYTARWAAARDLAAGRD